MLKSLIIFLTILFFSSASFAGKVYLMNSAGYNTAYPSIITAIQNNGYTVVVNDTNPTFLPLDFTSSCNDSVNGYDWLCFFGDADFSSLLPQIQAYITAGGKVYYQYEVTCCDISTGSAASILSSLTGLSITPNINPYIAANPTATGGWQSILVMNCDTVTFTGNAYKGLDGLPAANQFIASANIGGSTPLISTCTNYGFKFSTTDFVMTAAMGSICGIGDVNVWFGGNEPTTLLVDTNVVNFIFPKIGQGCALFPLDCSTSPVPPPPPVIVLPIECVLVMPNVFTPDNDNANETFHPVIMTCVENPIFTIYDRWGLKLFETNDLAAGWDGTSKQTTCSDGTYYWLVEYTRSDNKSKQKDHGFVTLIR